MHGEIKNFMAKNHFALSRPDSSGYCILSTRSFFKVDIFMASFLRKYRVSQKIVSSFEAKFWSRIHLYVKIVYFCIF